MKIWFIYRPKPFVSAGGSPAATELGKGLVLALQTYLGASELSGTARGPQCETVCDFPFFFNVKGAEKNRMWSKVVIYLYIVHHIL